MTRKHSEPAPLVGPIRYDLHIHVGEDVEPPVEFVVNALALPRVGDLLNFACVEEFEDEQGEARQHGWPSSGHLCVEVTHVSHWFFSTAEAPPRRTISVSAKSLPHSDELAKTLRKPGELEQWISHFPMLDTAT